MKKNRVGFGGAIALALSLLGATPSQAAEQVTLRFGPFEQTVKISEIETYAKTGELSPNLQLFGVFLTPEVRKGLNAKLAIDPKTSGAVVGKLLRSPAGQQLMTNVQSAAPGLTPELLQAGVSLAAQQIGGLDAIGVAKAIPTRTITIDLSQAVALGSKINLSYWKSQALGTLLEKSLVVEGSPVNFNSAIDPTAPGPIAYSKLSYTLADRARNDRPLPVDVFLSSKPSPQTPTRLLSGGNVQKVLLAREIAASPGLLVAASPTRGLDVGAIELVRGLLMEAARGGTGVLLITEDLEEAIALSDRIVVLFEGQIAGTVDRGHADVTELGLLMGGQK